MTRSLLSCAVRAKPVNVSLPARNPLLMKWGV